MSLSLQTEPSLTEMDSTLPSTSQSSEDLLTPPSDIMSDPLIEPIGSQTESKPASEAVSELSDDFVDLTNNVSEAVADTAAALAQDAAEISLNEPSDDFVDILGSETEPPQEEVAAADVTAEAAVSKSEVAEAVADPPGDDEEQEAEEASSAPVIDLGGDIIDLAADAPAANAQPPSSDPLLDLLSDAPPAADAKKPSSAAVDLFGDDGNDLFSEPLQVKSVKQPQKSLFGEADEDLFGEPLGATSKKATSKEQKDKPDTTKAAAAGGGDAVNVAGPLQESNPAEPADIFSEEAVATAPSISKASAVNSKTNGVHSEEETDIFAGGFHCFYSLASL